MGNAQVIFTESGNWCDYLGQYRFNMPYLNAILADRIVYILDETNIPIPDIPKYRPTAKRIYMHFDKSYLGYDWLGYGHFSKQYQDWINEWMLKGECYILDEL